MYVDFTLSPLKTFVYTKQVCESYTIKAVYRQAQDIHKARVICMYICVVRIAFERTEK